MKDPPALIDWARHGVTGAPEWKVHSKSPVFPSSLDTIAVAPVKASML